MAKATLVILDGVVTLIDHEHIAVRTLTAPLWAIGDEYVASGVRRHTLGTVEPFNRVREPTFVLQDCRGPSHCRRSATLFFLLENSVLVLLV